MTDFLERETPKQTKVKGEINHSCCSSHSELETRNLAKSMSGGISVKSLRELVLFTSRGLRNKTTKTGVGVRTVTVYKVGD